jgi:uncharacterized protein YbaR (Trm112 family)
MTITNDVRKAEWLLCPACHNKTRIKLRRDTILMHLPLFCPKCKQENLVNVSASDKMEESAGKKM